MVKWQRPVDRLHLWWEPDVTQVFCGPFSGNSVKFGLSSGHVDPIMGGRGWTDECLSHTWTPPTLHVSPWSIIVRRCFRGSCLYLQVHSLNELFGEKTKWIRSNHGQNVRFNLYWTLKKKRKKILTPDVSSCFTADVLLSQTHLCMRSCIKCKQLQCVCLSQGTRTNESWASAFNCPT